MNELYKALIAFNGETNKIDRATKAYNYKYAPLETVKDSVDKNLRKHGLGVVQTPTGSDGHIGVKTILFHESGQQIETEFGAQLVKNDPQTIGSYITYFRRYAYLSVLNLQPENEDDDAQGVKKNYDKNAAEKKEADVVFQSILAEISRLTDKFEDKDSLADILKKYMVKSGDELKRFPLARKEEILKELQSTK